MQFTLRVLPGTGTPSACNSAEYQAKLLQTVQSYVAEHGYAELANAANLANGRFLWRNRVGAEHVRGGGAAGDGKAEQQWRFDALAQNLRALDALSDEVKSLGSVIAEGLASGHVLLQVTAFLRVGAGQEVFPSQELILDRGRGDKSKTLYQIGEKGQEIAAIHSQKIGNALRTIDTWYEGAHDLGPIAVEPYGSVTTRKAYRQPKQKRDFYTLLDDWLLGTRRRRATAFRDGGPDPWRRVRRRELTAMTTHYRHHLVADPEFSHAHLLGRCGQAASGLGAASIGKHRGQLSPIPLAATHQGSVLRGCTAIPMRFRA